MTKLVTKSSVMEFLLGFIIGKLFGTIVSTWPYFEFMLDSNLSDIFFSEFNANLFSLNVYHLVLGLVGGLMLVIWRNNEYFD